VAVVAFADGTATVVVGGVGVRAWSVIGSWVEGEKALAFGAATIPA